MSKKRSCGLSPCSKDGGPALSWIEGFLQDYLTLIHIEDGERRIRREMKEEGIKYSSIHLQIQGDRLQK